MQWITLGKRVALDIADLLDEARRVYGELPETDEETMYLESFNDP